MDKITLEKYRGDNEQLVDAVTEACLSLSRCGFLLSVLNQRLEDDLDVESRIEIVCLIKDLCTVFYLFEERKRERDLKDNKKKGNI